LDTGSAAGRLVINIMTAVSQWEREAIGERTRDAMSHKKSDGQRVGNIAYGFRPRPGRRAPGARPARADCTRGDSRPTCEALHAARDRDRVERAGLAHPPRFGLAAEHVARIVSGTGSRFTT